VKVSVCSDGLGWASESSGVFSNSSGEKSGDERVTENDGGVIHSVSRSDDESHAESHDGIHGDEDCVEDYDG
jgi:hypothetical protein